MPLKKLLQVCLIAVPAAALAVPLAFAQQGPVQLMDSGVRVPTNLLQPEQTTLRFVVEDSELFPIVSPQGLTYGGGDIFFHAVGPLFCLNPNTAGDAEPVRLRVTDPNDHVVVNVPLSKDALFVYDPFGSLSPDFNGFSVAFADLARTSNCFFNDVNGDLRLFGEAPPVFDPDQIFSSNFLIPTEGLPDPRELKLSYVAPEQVQIGGFLTGALSYQLVAQNLSDQPIAHLGLQELLPLNPAFADAFLDSQFLLSCTASSGSSCGSFTSAQPNIRANGLTIAPGGTISISANRLISNASARGGFLELSAGTVAGDYDAGKPANDVAVARIWIVGTGTWIHAGLDTTPPINGFPVRSIEPGTSEPVGLTVRSWDSDPDGTGETTPKIDIPVAVSGVERCAALEPGGECTWLELVGSGELWGDDLIDQFLRITPSQGVTAFLDTEADPLEAGLNFAIYSEFADRFRVTFEVPANLRQAADVLDSAGAVSQVEILFAADAPTSLDVVSIPDTITAGQCASVTTQILDQFGNPVAGTSVAGNVTSPAPGDLSNGCPSAAQTSQTNISGQASFSFGAKPAGALNLSFSAAGVDPVTASTLIVAGEASSLIMDFPVISSLAIDQSIPDFTLTVLDSFGNTSDFSGNLDDLVLRGPAGTISGIAWPGVPFSGGQLTLSGLVLPQSASAVGPDRNIRAQIERPDGSLSASTSPTFEVTPAATSLAIVEIVPTDSQIVDEPFTINVQVDGLDPTGAVAISNGVGGNCSASLDSSGFGNCQLSISAPGKVTITANYPGDALNSAGTDTANYEIVLP